LLSFSILGLVLLFALILTTYLNAFQSFAVIYLHLFILLLKVLISFQITKRHGQMINTPASYSGGPVFNGPVTYPD
jgi:hypothetical protein